MTGDVGSSLSRRKPRMDGAGIMKAKTADAKKSRKYLLPTAILLVFEMAAVTLWLIWDSSAARTCRLRGSGTISLRAYLKPQPSIMLPLRSLGHYFLAGDGVALPVGRPWSLISFPIKSLKSRERALAGFVTSHSQPRLFLSQPCSSHMLVILKGLCSGLLS